MSHHLWRLFQLIEQLTQEEYQLITTALRKLLVEETCRLEKENASDREWEVLNNIDNTLIKCQFLELNLRNNGKL